MTVANETTQRIRPVFDFCIQYIAITYKVGQKVRLQLLLISLPIIDRFSKFFYRHIFLKNLQYVVTKYLTTAKTHRYIACKI